MASSSLSAVARTREGGIGARLGLGAQKVELAETLRLVWRYVLQESLDPLKGLAKRAGLAIGGVLVLAVGLVVLAIALLRVLQRETGTTFAGDLTFLPYLLTAVAAVIAIGVAAAIGLRAGRGGHR